MIKRIGTIVIILLLTLSLSYANDDIQQKINKINQDSEYLLGISLTALLYLNEASPNAYFLLEHLESSGKLQDIKELERKGYVTLEVVEQLPDGQIYGKHLRIIPTSLGYKVKTCIQNIQIAKKKT